LQEYLYCEKKLAASWASYQRCCQRNRRSLLTTGSDGRTLFTTVDNTCHWRQQLRGTGARAPELAHAHQFGNFYLQMSPVSSGIDW